MCNTCNSHCHHVVFIHVRPHATVSEVGPSIIPILEINGGSGRLSDLPRVTQLGTEGGICIEVGYALNPSMCCHFLEFWNRRGPLSSSGRSQGAGGAPIWQPSAVSRGSGREVAHLGRHRKKQALAWSPVRKSSCWPRARSAASWGP